LEREAAVTGGFDEIVDQDSPQVGKLAQQARDLIRVIMPEVVEVAWPRQRIISFGIGQKKMSEHFCYLGLFKNHMNLGFYYGADLPDPQGLLEGTGKLLHHIKITSGDQLEMPVVHRLLEAASQYFPKLNGD
jgi:hypothetical protein